MATLTDYKGLQVVDPDPTGDGGLAIQDDFKSLVDWHPKSVWAQTAAPTVNDDLDDDFYPGSLWLRTNTSPAQLFVCQSSSNGAAVWVQLVTPNMDVTFDDLTADGNLTVNGTATIDDRLAVTNNVLVGTTSDITADGGAVLVLGDNGSTDPTFAASTWGLWAHSSTLKTNAGILHIDPQGSNVSATMVLDRAGTGVAQWRFYTSGVSRWIIGMPAGDESGSNNGADLNFFCYSDAGTLIATPLTIKRSTGVTTFNKAATFADGLTASKRATLSAGMSSGIVTKTGAYTITDSDSVVLCDASGGAFTITLPSAASVTGRMYTIKRINATNNVTIGTTSSQTIDGATTYVLSSQYAVARVISNGSNWLLI